MYCFWDKDGKVIDGLMDDGEFGVGRNLLKYFEECGYENIVCVIIRWYGGEYFGVVWFGLMREFVD